MTKKILLLVAFLVSTISISAQLIYTPYTVALGSLVNGKPTWGKAQTIYSSSIFVSKEKVQFNMPEKSMDMTFYGYQNVKKGKTKKGNLYFYYTGMRSSNGTSANMRIDFYPDDWVMISVFIPSMPGNNCLRFKCKLLTEM